jgi:2-polyprenyl-6-hydroxyphenyl methylase/3-demethylubiquinone-9 3-methyltransferase
MTVSTIDPAEVAKFSAIAAEWWDPTGKFAPLHKFNPVRLGFSRHPFRTRHAFAASI